MDYLTQNSQCDIDNDIMQMNQPIAQLIVSSSSLLFISLVGEAIFILLIYRISKDKHVVKTMDKILTASLSKKENEFVFKPCCWQCISFSVTL